MPTGCYHNNNKKLQREAHEMCRVISEEKKIHVLVKGIKIILKKKNKNLW